MIVITEGMTGFLFIIIHGRHYRRSIGGIEQWEWRLRLIEATAPVGGRMALPTTDGTALSKERWGKWRKEVLPGAQEYSLMQELRAAALRPPVLAAPKAAMQYAWPVGSPNASNMVINDK